VSAGAPRIPIATYRLQLNRTFTLADAAAQADYLAALGVSDCYLSPVYRAHAGSVHGYDVVDHGEINPELGGAQALAALAAAAGTHGLGLVMDVVPNHMCILGGDNGWWIDVLENGPSSPFARHFDIDWNPPRATLADKVLLPVLGDQYGRVLERQEIRLVYDAGAFTLHYFEHWFPVAPKTWTAVLEPAVAAVTARLGPGDPAVLELESIITALTHLPLRAETDPALVIERQREKEIVKRRLRELVEGSDEVRRAVEAAVAETNGRAGDPRSFDRLEALLAEQAYRLSFWRVATDEINYRRFFDINELAAIRVEEPAVHEAVHAWPLRSLVPGHPTGLRIDHVDGLLDPLDYLGRLPRDRWTVVEKILVGDERLHADWPVHGTTGYEFLNLVNGLFVDPTSAPALLDLYARFAGERREFADVVYESKKLVLQVALSSELTVLARRLDDVSEQHRFSRDFTFASLQDALAEIVACFPVYRTYMRTADEAVHPDDRRHVQAATRAAKRRNPATSASIFDFIAAVLLRDDPEGLDPEQVAARRDFVLRFQQLTGPVMAKGMEDTAAFRFHPLASLAEVGGQPDRFGLPPDQFHRACTERRARWPHGLSATSTHDTKRSEDVRARIDVLSEVPDRWAEAALRWRELARPLKATTEDGIPIPDGSPEYLLYQTLIGTWPLTPPDDAGRAAYIERIQAYLRKALREAKVRTSWINPDDAYEEAALAFVRTLLEPAPDNRFLDDFIAFQRALVRPGLLGSLSQTLLKIAAPGVPDFYQGTELWDASLVDPDNRRPVDFARRRALLAALAATPAAALPALADELLVSLEDGRAKLLVIQRGLALRRARHATFAEGDHVPLEVAGARERHAIAFARTGAAGAVIAVTGRFFTGLPDPPIGPAWDDTALRLPAGLGGRWREALTDRPMETGAGDGGGALPLAAALAHLPVALLERVG
jgi:(1->4)-alpha-D-glucan 1-alpha-D-glucosylmutase